LHPLLPGLPLQLTLSLIFRISLPAAAFLINNLPGFAEVLTVITPKYPTTTLGLAAGDLGAAVVVASALA
jgi:hypothetical protein